jgi:hypothetical protein
LWALLVLLLPTVAVLAQGSEGGQAARQPAATYDLSWFSVDGGGWTMSTGGEYALAGTIGQPDAGLLQGGGYALAGGFWGSAGAGGWIRPVYLPIMLRGGQ